MRRVVLALNSLGQRGTDRVAVHLAQGFADAGLDTELLVCRRGGTGESVLLPLVPDKVRLTYLGGGVVHRKLDLVAEFPALVAHLRRAGRTCMISNGNHMNWMCAAATAVVGAEARPRLLLKMTNPIVRPQDGPIEAAVRRRVYDWAFAESDRVLCLSRREASELAGEYGGDGSRFAPVINPYVTPEMLACPSRRRAPGEPPVILSIAVFSTRKRLDLLVRAFARTTTPGARLVLAGDGKERERIEALVRELGLGERVEFPGYVSEVAGLLARADVLALCSTYEGLPAAVLEAMAANCPVVCTDCFAAVDELVRGAEACAVTPADAEAIARALDATLARPRPRELRERAARYSIAEGVRSHIEAMQGLL
jgi:glycosyltransferase involved in cell wall biosynthesis